MINIYLVTLSKNDGYNETVFHKLVTSEESLTYEEIQEFCEPLIVIKIQILEEIKNEK